MPSLRKITQDLRAAWLRQRNPADVTRHGVRLPVRPDLVPAEVADLIFRDRYERQEAQIARRHLTAGDRVLELGGGIGFMGTLAAQICGSDNVVTYEGNPGMERVIRATHALNDVAPSLQMQAVARESGPVTFFLNDNVISSSLIDRDFGGGTTVPGRAMREILAEVQPTAIVCDIEGAEIEVFADADLGGVQKILIELHPKIVGAEANAAFLTMLEAQGFALVEGTRDKVAFLQRRA